MRIIGKLKGNKFIIKSNGEQTIYDIVNVENNISISYLVRYDNTSMDLVPKSHIMFLTEWRKIRIGYILNELHMYKQ